MALEICQLTKENIEILANLLTEYRDFYGVKSNSLDNQNYLQNFIDAKEGIFFIATQNKEPVGYVNLYFSYSSVSTAKIAILNDLYVRKNQRSKGYGKELIDHAINTAKTSGFSQVRWCTHNSNKQAQNLYKKYQANISKWLHYDLTL